MSKIFKIFRSLEVILKSKKPLFSFFKKSASISSTLILNNVKHYAPTINTVIDVGANMGQFALASNSFFPSAHIYSFEPVPGTYSILTGRVNGTANIKTFNCALGSNEGEIDFYSNVYSHASSALPVSDAQKNLVSKSLQETKIKVKLQTLDNMMGGMNVSSPVLLKLDVQGFEKEVLLGATESLQKIDYILIESSFVSMYNGEPLFDEMHTFIKSLGFEIVAPVGYLQTEDLQFLQMDVLYKRK